MCFMSTVYFYFCISYSCIILFIWWCWIFNCSAWAFSSCKGWELLFLAVHRLWALGLQQLQLTGSGAPAQQLQCTGSVAPRHAGSPRIRGGAHVSCIGRWILNQ